ncbi:MAG: PIG-L family deacetylase [Bacillaceae bacterium]|nr:PIG-L family deacetylase [Bacillaceae bacterium]
MDRKNKVLVIAAHPDDEVLGVGGTIAFHVNIGDQVDLLMVTEGSSTQYQGQPEKIQQKKDELQKVKEILGIHNIYYLDLPDMKLDTLANVELNATISQKISQINPDIVYTHFYGDVNSDHQELFKATMVATRPVENNNVKKVLCYYTPSSTEWNIQNSNNIFMPNVFVDISKFLNQKIEAMNCYKSELRPYPHPRSEEALVHIAKYWGLHTGVHAAEPFMLVREVINKG